MDQLIGFDKSEIFQSIPKRFEKIVELYPTQIAIRANDNSLSYRELNQITNQVAREVIAYRSTNQQEVVLLLFGHNEDVIISILSVLKTGKIYTVLDPKWPEARLNQVILDTQSSLILTNDQHIELVQKLAANHNLDIINIHKVESRDANNLNLSIAPTNLAGIFYTSGSTGNPKGVTRSHQFLHHIIWLNTQSMGGMLSSDRCVLIHFCGSAASTTSIFGSLLNGITLYLFDLKKFGTGAFIMLIIEQEITHFRSPSALFYQFCEELSADIQFTKLRFVNVSGDKLYIKAVRKFWLHCANECVLQHIYGSSESPFISEFLITSSTEISVDSIPIGRVVADKQVFILSEQGEKLEYNQVGEIAVKSRYLSSGYWHNSELTQQQFIPCDDGEHIYLTGDLGQLSTDGMLQLLGRKDFMVKIRGHRIELAEIEVALSSLKEVQQAVVIVQTLSEGEKRLVAYVTGSEHSTLTISSLRQYLSSQLPDYCIPAIFMILDQFPITATGKIDRLALPLPSSARPEVEQAYVTARTPVEESLTAIWQSVLQIQPIGIYDRFLDLGGNSLQAMQIVNQVLKQLQAKVPLKFLLESATIAEMASVVNAYLSASIDA